MKFRALPQSSRLRLLNNQHPLHIFVQDKTAIMTQINKWPMDTLAQPMSLAATEQASGLPRLQFIKRLLNQGLQVFQGAQDAVLAWQNLSRQSDFLL
jgi:hypothetical protein